MPPTQQQYLQALEATWPAAAHQTIGPWTIRQGDGGGKRVSAATVCGAFKIEDIAEAEAAMSDLNQDHLFMIHPGDDLLDQTLAENGYRILDPVSLYACPIRRMVGGADKSVSTHPVWPPGTKLKTLWAAGDIDAGRLRVMQRATGPKTAILVRNAGCAFVAKYGPIAMIHAIEVSKSERRKGIGINILNAAAHWAQDQGAQIISLAVTDANTAANGLYRKLGMSVVGKYHYRIRIQ